ncbi:CRE-CRI-2 protein-like protein [Leptotrombidium deliense]|uniref:CRE-CRI-2 protein-like protein n=1 Tax=Leptotrombidium deliense TaxID=299467 RepID=A0A443SDF1_9ACAR|nr:CRE-CRI-2 protein-like protein [Leptotrombidium deliense]
MFKQQLDLDHEKSIMLCICKRVYACFCASPKLEESFCKAKNIVHVSVSDEKVEKQSKIYTVVVEKVLKGDKDALSKLTKLKTGQSSASCGISLKTGEKYLVIVTINDGEMSANSCSNIQINDKKAVYALMQNPPDAKVCEKYSKQ